MRNRRFTIFPDSPSLRQVFSARSLRVRWRSGDPVITAIIMALCIALWIVETIFRFIWPSGLAAILNFGMLQPLYASQEPWTFLTSMFLHQPASLWHITFNMLTLWCIGPFLERLMGHWEFLMLYIISGIGGGVGMMLWAGFGGSPQNWLNASYGASGALFGLFAACLVVYRSVGEDLRPMMMWMIINFLMPVVIPNIAWQAHVAGFIIGGLYTMLTIEGVRALKSKPVIVRFSIYGAALLLLLIIMVLVCNASNPLYQVPITFLQ